MRVFGLWMIVAILTICGNMDANAQHKVTNSRKMSADIRRAAVRQKTMEKKICAFVKFKTDNGEKLLAKYGCEKVTQIGNIYIARIPTAKLEAMADDKEVERIETQKGGKLMNNVTPQWVNTGDIHAGTGGLPQAYDGTNVLMGIIDTGFDVTHPAFYGTDGTTYRIKGFVDCYYDENETRGVMTPLGREYTTKEDILGNMHPGDAENDHGTHTLGTAAGSGYGTPYRGMAYGADIFAISSNNAGYDHVCNTAEQTACMKRIFDYADQTKQPCVISYSIGFDDVPSENVLFREALKSMLGPGRILVASVGNNGGFHTYLHKPAGMETAGSVINYLEDEAILYLSSKQPFNLKLLSCEILSDETYSTIISHTMTDSITISSEALPTDSIELNGHHILVEKTDTCYTIHSRNEYPFSLTVPALAFIIEGKEADVQAYISQSTCLDFYYAKATLSDSRFDDARSTHSIGLPASIPEVIAVGALCGRLDFTNILGKTINTCPIPPLPYGQITSFSSIGPAMSGIRKPDVVAPGLNVISAGNSYYEDSFGSTMVAKTTFNEREYPWVAMSGTSMSGPCVAGIVALWLQADPTLTPERVLEIISETCHETDDSMTYPNNTYGYGLIDAYAGMLKVLNITTAIPEISTHQPAKLRIQPNEQGVRLSFETAPIKPFSVSIYTVGGQIITKQNVQPNDSHIYDIDLPTKQKGICVVQVNSTEAGVTGSELIRY